MVFRTVCMTVEKNHRMFFCVKKMNEFCRWFCVSMGESNRRTHLTFISSCKNFENYQCTCQFPSMAILCREVRIFQYLSNATYASNSMSQGLDQTRYLFHTGQQGLTVLPDWRGNIKGLIKKCSLCLNALFVWNDCH